MPIIYPIGIQKCNPGNLDWSDTQQQLGAIGKYQLKNHVFAEYPNPETGYKCLTMNIFHYDRVLNIHTLYDFGETWCPAKDNSNDNSYGAKLAKQLGILVDQKLSLLDWLPELCRAITINEQGYAMPWPKEVVNRGILLATVAETQLKHLGGA